MISCQFEGFVENIGELEYWDSENADDYVAHLRFTVRCDVPKNTQWLDCELMGEAAERAAEELDFGTLVRMNGSRISLNEDSDGRAAFRFLPNKVRVIESLTLEVPR